MKILVCISHVPDTTTKIKFKDNKLDATGVQYIIGPYDDYALARAVELQSDKGAKITVLNVGGIETEPTIRKALAIGADDAIRVDAQPIDAMFVAEQIVAVAKEENYDLILMGRESSDFNGGLVHGLVGEMLDLPSISPCMKLDLESDTATLNREIEGGKETLEIKLPFVAGCQEPIAEWKIPNMRGIMMARKKPLKVIPAVKVSEITEYKSFGLPAEKTTCKMIDPENMNELANLLKNEAKVL